VIGSLAGLVAFDVTVFVAGAGVAAAAQPTRALRSVLAPAGLVFWLGLAFEGVALTWAASLGAGPSILLVLAVAAVAVVLAVGLRVRVGRPKPWRAGPPVSLPAAVGYSLVTLACVAEVLAAWNHPTNEWDSWAFWVPKARLLYESGHLHVAEWTLFSGTTYPPLVPLVHGAAFAFMGASDDVSLHLQTALFFVAFVHGVVTISRRFASDLYVVPFALLLATMPEVLHRALQLDGDYPTEFAFVLGALCCVIFLREPARWPLVYAALLLAAAANTRREGLIYVAAVLAGAVVLGVLRRPNGLWLALPALAAGVAAVPWLLWVRVHHVVADSVPPPGVIESSAGGGDAGGSVVKALHVLLDYLFRFGFWSAAPYVGLAVLVVAFVAGRRSRSLGIFVVSMLAVMGIGMLWRLLWYGGQLNPQGTPIPRISGAWALLLCVVAPIVLAASVPARQLGADRVLRPVLGRLPLALGLLLPAAVVAAVLVPRLQGRLAGCESPPSALGKNVVVFGYPGSYVKATRLSAAVARSGFTATTIGSDRCGRLRVQTSAVPLRVARSIEEEARAVDVSVVLKGA
jgi:hypothetical protein